MVKRNQLTRRRKNTTRRKQRGGNKDKLKIAVLFSGRVKGYKHALDDLRKLQEAYDVVFFASINMKERPPYIDTFCKDLDIKDEQINIERTILPDWVNTMEVHPLNKRYNVYSVIYHNKKAFEMVGKYQDKHNMKFDGVLVYRADMNTPNGVLKFEKPEDNTIYVSDNMMHASFHPANWKHVPGICVEIVYGNFDTIRKYCSAVDKLKDLGIPIFHEGIAEKHAQNENMKVVKMAVRYSLHPTRHDPDPEYNNYVNKVT